MPKDGYTAKPYYVRAEPSKATSNPDTVVICSLVTDRRDKDRPILTELTSAGARTMAARLIEQAEVAEAAKGRADDR